MIYKWQKLQWQQLTQAVAQQRLHHAILLYGHAGTGKADFAQALAHALLCEDRTQEQQACGRCHACSLLAAGTHPDYSFLKPLPPKDSKSANPVLSIRIDAVRELCGKLNTTSQFGGRRVAVILDADKMGHNAANSLLKTLEEPGDNTHLILVSSRPHRLPITIRSRTMQVVFPIPPVEQASAWLEQQGDVDADQALQHCHGAPLAAASDTDTADSREVLSKALLARTGNQPSLQYSDALSKLPRTAMLTMLMDWLTDLARLKSGSRRQLSNDEHRKGLSSIATQADWKRIYRLQDELCRLIRSDAIALNNQLLWENLLISWDRL